jgi:hypothetical protein
MHLILEESNKKITVQPVPANKKTKAISGVDAAQKRAILAQYSQVSDGDEYPY